MPVDSIVDDFVLEVQRMMNSLALPVALAAVALTLVLFDVTAIDRIFSKIVGKSPMRLYGPITTLMNKAKCH